MQKKIISCIDGEVIDMERLTRRQLKDLHYREETAMAKKILSASPFSEERKQLMGKGYSLVCSIQMNYRRNESTWGATSESIKVLEDIVRTRINNKKRKQMVYEAGVGKGSAFKSIVNISNVQYVGCDVFLEKEVEDLGKKYENLIIRQNTLYDDLILIKDNSIDVFYADNVVEHILPDESKKTFDLLYKKMKPGGILYMIIPNRFMGPHDISGAYQKKGSKATGFHFMEMSYGETICKFIASGFRPDYIFSKDRIVEKDKWYLKNLKRLTVEYFISKVKSEVLRKELYKRDIYNVYIFSK